MHRRLENLTDTKEGPDRDGPTSLDLLPMARREPEGNHVLLAIAIFLPEATDSLTQRAEESLLIQHALGCRVPQAKTPRAD
jgi:hypothetical protein